jgi:uncharacterized protein YdeI (YjbR/CyaY-like superfamily)
LIVQITQALYLTERTEWRAWLAEHFQSEPEIWLLYPRKATGRPRIAYNDAVEEALCFGWIDSIIKSYDEETSAQRFTPRRAGSGYSQTNKERLRRLFAQGQLHASVLAEAEAAMAEAFEWPADIMEAIQANTEVWAHFQTFSKPYQRIRVAYIETARKRGPEFEKRLNSFLKKTEQGRQFGFGGIEAYY